MLLATHGRFGTVMQARGRPLGVLYSVLKAALFLACLATQDSMPLIFCLATPVAAVVINGRTDPAATCDTIKVFGRKLDESARTRSAYSPTSASVDLEFLG